MPTKCLIHNCTKPSVSKGLCDTHRKRVERHGSAEQTRPKDWGQKERHPSYRAWCGLRRYHLRDMPEHWVKDFWSFVSETPVKPEGKAAAQRVDVNKPWGADNFYWRQPILSSEKLADRRAYMREWSRNARKANPDYHKSAKLKKMYGITIDEYNRMLTNQNGCCDICGKAEGNEIKGKVVALAVDHCHKTGAVRALLCSACNTALGLFNDDPELLAKARSYVLHHEQTERL